MDAMKVLLYRGGVEFIAAFQNKFPDAGEFFVMISTIGDPRYAFTFYFPLVFAFSWTVGAKLLATAVIAEWLNQILKWLTYGDRPYWWVHETDMFGTDPPPHLHQTPITCETGPGNPSGHSMLMSATWYFIIQALIENVVEPSKDMSEGMKSVLKSLLWLFYVGFLILVVLSRLYIVTHFPHQCAGGLLCGFTLALFLYNFDTLLKLSRPSYVFLTIFIFLSAIGTYGLLLAVGGNPSWSVDLAVKWCIKREYIHIDTTPFYSMMRYCGAILGLGLGLTSSHFRRSEKARFSLFTSLVALAAMLFAGKMAEFIHHLVPKGNLNLFYVLELILNTIFPYVVIGPLRHAIMNATGATPKAKSR